jgi:hypothetical protein
MAKATFPYVAISLPPNQAYPQGATVFRPVTFATLTATNGQSIRCTVLPDSGADACLFPLSLAILLKLDVLNSPKALTGGVGSQANLTYYDTITIDLGAGISFSAYAGFTQGMDPIGLGLLGQAGFFEKRRVEFLHAKKVFTIESNWP